MEADYETFPVTSTRKRQTSTYGKKGKNRSNSNSNLSSRLLTNPSQSRQQEEQQEKRGNSTQKIGFIRATSEVQLGKRRRKSKQTSEGKEKQGVIEGSQSDGDGSLESNEGGYDITLSSIRQTKRPRASSHDITTFPISLSSQSSEPSAPTNQLTIINTKGSYSSHFKPINIDSATSKSQFLNPTFNLQRKSFKGFDRGIKSSCIDDARGIKYFSEVDNRKSKASSKTKEVDSEPIDSNLEKEKDLETMMQYVMMDSEELDHIPFTSQHSSNQIQRNRPRVALLASTNFPPSFPSNSVLVLGEKSNLPRSAQDKPISTSTYQFSYNLGSTSGSATTERTTNSKKSNLKIAQLATSNSRTSLKVFRDESTTPRSSSSILSGTTRVGSSNKQLSSSNIRRATSLNTEGVRQEALNLNSLSDALLSEINGNTLGISSHSHRIDFQASTLISPSIARHSSVPLSNNLNSAQEKSTIFTTNKIQISDPHSVLREVSLIPIDVVGMDSSMILESSDPENDQIEEEEDNEGGNGLFLLFGDNDGAKLSENKEVVKKSIVEVKEIGGTQIEEVESFPSPRFIKVEVKKHDEVTEKMEIDAIPRVLDEARIRMKQDNRIEDEETIVGITSVEKLNHQIISPAKHQDINSILPTSLSIMCSSPQIQTRNQSDSDEDEEEDLETSYWNTSSEFSFILPPRTISNPVDQPTSNGRPNMNEDYLAYYIRTSSTGESEDIKGEEEEEEEEGDEENEFDEREIGEGSKPGSRIDASGLSRREKEKIAALKGD